MAVFATVLALAACGSDVPEDPSLSVGPSLPTEGTDAESGESLDESDPTATPPTATPAVATPPEVTGTATESTGTTPAPTGTTTATPPEATTATSVDTTTASPTDATTAAPTETSAAADELPGFAEPGEQETQDATGPVQLLIDDVRVGSHDGYDRVVLDLSGTGEVGWSAQYVTDPALDGSGAPVDLAGQFVLQVNLQGMAYPEPGDTAYEEAELLVDGGDLTTVTEILRSAPFEGQVPVFIGTSTEAPFRVFALSDPRRLVIDLQH